MQLKITFIRPGRNPRNRLFKPLIVWMNGMCQAVRGSMYEVLEYLTSIGFSEDEIKRLGIEFTEAGHTVLETDKITEADLRRVLEPEQDIAATLMYMAGRLGEAASFS